jgi:hypothetical protein
MVVARMAAGLGSIHKGQAVGTGEQLAMPLVTVQAPEAQSAFDRQPLGYTQ